MVRSSPSPAKNKESPPSPQSPPSPSKVIKKSKQLEHETRPISKVVHVIRHGEGQHQIKKQRMFIKPELGPALTRRGMLQARALRNKVKTILRSSASSLVVSSNLLRAVQTALFAFPKLPVVVQPLARERIANAHDHPAELGALQHLSKKLRSKSSLRSKASLDLNHYRKTMRQEGSHSAYLAGLWADDRLRKDGQWQSGDQDALYARAKELTSWIEAQKAEHIFLVTHGAFIMHLTGDSYYDNTEMRTYVVQDGMWRKQRSRRSSVKSPQM
jgi:broad specificity phosphatase PhoE